MERRFWKHVRRTRTCWLWIGAKAYNGYGKVGAGGGGSGHRYAHRVCYEMLVGPIPFGMSIDHLCRRRACIRPDHLEVVSTKVNVQRAWDASRDGRCKYGHPATVDNIYRKPNGNIAWCRPCHAIAEAMRRDRRRSA